MMRSLSCYFKVSQEAFNRRFKLMVAEDDLVKNIDVMNHRKK
jgi:HTH-type transcriptional regulator / antitoxin HigA